MPSVARISREDIIECAFRMMKESGYEELSARKLAGALQSSTQPVYSQFTDMGDLKKELYKRSGQYFTEKIYQNMRKDKPMFLEIGIQYVRQAKIEKNVFRFLSMENNYSLSGMQDLVKNIDIGMLQDGVDNRMDMTDISEEKWKELSMMTWIFTHGLATITANNDVVMSDQELEELLTKSFLAFWRQINNEEDR